VTPCSLVDIYPSFVVTSCFHLQNLGTTFPEDGSNIFIRNVCNHLPAYTESHPTRRLCRYPNRSLPTRSPHRVRTGKSALLSRLIKRPQRQVETSLSQLIYNTSKSVAMGCTNYTVIWSEWVYAKLSASKSVLRLFRERENGRTGELHSFSRRTASVCGWTTSI
jgi:hypothetical protein